MDSNPFLGGVKPGSPRTSQEIKILICYLLSGVREPVSRDVVNEILQTEGLVNYFEFTSTFAELLSLGHITAVTDENGNEKYCISPSGAQSAHDLEKVLPLSVRDHVIKTATKLLLKLKREAEGQVTITPSQTGYQVSCSIPGATDQLLTVSLYVPDKRQAQRVKEQFLSNPTLLYTAVIAALTGDKKALSAALQEETPKDL